MIEHDTRSELFARNYDDEYCFCAGSKRLLNVIQLYIYVKRAGIFACDKAV